MVGSTTVPFRLIFLPILLEMITVMVKLPVQFAIEFLNTFGSVLLAKNILPCQVVECILVLEVSNTQ